MTGTVDPKTRVFVRVRLGPGSDPIEAARWLGADSVVCRSNASGHADELWLEPADGAPRLDAALLAERGLETLELLAAIPIVELINSASIAPPTHRLYLHYLADQSALEDLDAWYTEEHEQMLMRSPCWNRIRRFSTDGSHGLDGRLVVHDVSDPNVLASEQLRAAMGTPWRDRLNATGWFGRSPRDPWIIVRDV